MHAVSDHFRPFWDKKNSIFLVREPRFHEKCETHAKIEDRGSVFGFLNSSGLGLQHIKSFQGKVDFEYEAT